MKLEKAVLKQAAACVLLVLVALASLGVSDFLSSPEFHAESLASLDEKKVTVMELTAASAAASVAISAVPGDATTPIANQVSELSSYLLLVTGVILLEKILLTLTGYLAFKLLIPIACALVLLSLVCSRAFLRQLALKLAVFGLALWLLIPASLQVSNLVEDTFEVQQTVEQAAQAADDLEESEEAAEDSGWLSQIGDAISGAVSGVVEEAENTLSRFVDAIATLVIINCVIPLLVLWLFLWLAKVLLGIRIEIPVQKLRKALPTAGKGRAAAAKAEDGSANP